MDTESLRPAARAALAALPQDLTPTEAAPDLSRLLDADGQRPLPLGRLRRGWILGSLQARVAAGYMASWVRGGFVGEDEKTRLRNEAHLRAALQLLGTMGYLRGVVMKVGQTLANYPELAPEEFVETLGALHFEAPPMHFSLLREMVKRELGADPEQLFAEFDTNAFAAASLGQVHRARLPDGTEVAVKIQYPGIDRAIREDFRNVSALMLPMRFSERWENLRRQFEDIRAMLDLELDYEAEADFQERVRAMITPETEVVVPRVHRRWSSARVLTTDMLHGLHLDDFLATSPDQQVRDRHGKQILHSAMRTFGRRLCYADPHPGNYLFLEDGRLGLIDFGSCRALDDEDWAMCELMTEGFYGGKQAFERGLEVGTSREVGETLPPEHERMLREMVDWLWEPMYHQGVFDFSGEYFPRGMALFEEIMSKRFTRSAPVNTWINRNFLGVRAMLYRLGARVDMAALTEVEMHDRIDPAFDIGAMG
ncbi:MAG: ABC1 kinase family protein [Planctomycetota bacterium]|jgi:predicted unusual protein kinase regulating ubiquinone biosynthesis (AarF/ABC1/UbiB family)